MPKSADVWRRWFGLLFLALAFGMLIWGQTVFRDRLKNAAYIVYWSICFLLTFAAIVTALLDLRATRRRALDEHRDLLRKTLDEIEREAGDRDEKGPTA